MLICMCFSNYECTRAGTHARTRTQADMHTCIICDLPRENRPSSHLVMIVEIPVLKFLIGATSFCSCQADYLW